MGIVKKQKGIVLKQFVSKTKNILSVYMSETNMFNEASFWEVLLPSYPIKGEVSIETYVKGINFAVMVAAPLPLILGGTSKFQTKIIGGGTWAKN